MLLFASIADCVCQVVRRNTYKGGLSAETSLPVDGTTVMGILVIVGSLLSAPGLPQKTLDACCSVLGAMEEKAALPDTLQLLPNARELCLHVSNNRVDLKSLKEALKKLEIAWSRPG